MIDKNTLADYNIKDFGKLASQIDLGLELFPKIFKDNNSSVNTNKLQEVVN